MTSKDVSQNSTDIACTIDGTGRIQGGTNLEWGKDPLYMTYRKLLVRWILTKVVREEVNGNYHLQYHDRPILKAEVVGIIVNVILSSKRQTYYVDDGTGVIRCVKFLSDNGNYNKSTITSSGDIKSKVDNIDATEISVGDLVSVRGMLAYSETNTDDYGIFIHIIRIETIEDSNYESYYKLKCLVLEKEVYTKH